MTSYLVLEAPGGPDKDHASTRFIADRFSWLALIAPWIWLAVHRLWLAAIATVLLQIIASVIAISDGFAPVGLLTGLAIALLVAFEGRNFTVRHLVAKGWTMKSVITAPDLGTAEDLYFSQLPEIDASAESAIPEPVWKPSAKDGRNFAISDPAGSFQFDLNGRR
jgi:hypothetical protein